MARFTCSETVHCRSVELFELLTDPNRLPELIDSFIEVEVLVSPQVLQPGSEVSFLMKRFKLAQEVRIEVLEYIKGQKMVISQREGVFSKWTYSIVVEPVKTEDGHEASKVQEVCDYDLPLGLLGAFADDLYVKKDLEQIVKERLERAKSHLEKDFNMSPEPTVSEGSDLLQE